MTKRSYQTEFILLTITLGIIALMLFLNDINRHIRIKEVRIYLQKNNHEENNVDHITLVMKYRIQKKLYENQIRQDDADLIEMRANSILAETATSRSAATNRYTFLSGPSVFMINFFRSIIRKGPIRYLTEDPVNIYLGVAYYYERNNSFAGALRVYDRAMEEEQYNLPAIAGIVLHQGYCHAVMGNYDAARKKYLTVIREYEDAPASATAVILLRYLEGFRTEIGRILKKDKDSVEKAGKLLTLLAFREALDIIERIEQKALPADRARITYIKGRCLDGLSEKEKAIDTYQEIVANNPASPYSALANRRIYLSGAVATNGAKVKYLAAGNNRSVVDPVFVKMIDQEKKLLGAGQEKTNTPFSRELAKEEKQHPVLDIGKVKALARPGSAIKKKIVAEKRPAPAREKIPEIIFRIETVEGNVFVGSIRKETGEHIILHTMFGNVSIPKNKIKCRGRTGRRAF